MSDCAADRDLIFGEISAERRRQDEEWGGSAHDDSHELFEWGEFIRKQNNAAIGNFSKPQEFEARMVKVAALAVAAIESSRRQRPPGERPRA